MKTDPYWWEAAPRLDSKKPLESGAAPDRSYDVAIVGSGFTGLSAALHLAKAGRKVAVFDKQRIGEGASSRNAGFVGRTLKFGFTDLEQSKGLAHAIGTYREMQTAFASVRETIEAFGIDCHYRANGRLVLAANAKQYDEIAGEYAARAKHLGSEFSTVDRAGLRTEIASDRYFGGIVVPDLSALHPGLYHQGMVRAAERLGVTLHGELTVTGLRQAGPGWRLMTERGAVAAGELVLATNGYRDGLVPFLERRLIPFDAWMVATEPLSPGLIARLLPKDRTYIDSNMNVDAIRRSPDGRHLLYCGKTGVRSEPRRMAQRLLGELRAIFPDLRAARLAHGWTGRCAATFDLLPHLGTHDGIHYAVGYCFAGVPMGTHFGRLVAQRILKRGPVVSVFADLPFPTLPLYRGGNWFVPWAMRYYDWRDGKRHAA